MTRAVVFEWDDSAERSGLNRVAVASTDGSGGVSVLVDHAGHASVVCLPRHAVDVLVAALTEHLENTTPDDVVLHAVNRYFHASSPGANEALANRVIEALREAGHLAPRP